MWPPSESLPAGLTRPGCDLDHLRSDTKIGGVILQRRERIEPFTHTHTPVKRIQEIMQWAGGADTAQQWDTYYVLSEVHARPRILHQKIGAAGHTEGSVLAAYLHLCVCVCALCVCVCVCVYVCECVCVCVCVCVCECVCVIVFVFL